jgi:hypothetical protein
MGVSENVGPQHGPPEIGLLKGCKQNCLGKREKKEEFALHTLPTWPSLLAVALLAVAVVSLGGALGVAAVSEVAAWAGGQGRWVQITPTFQKCLFTV